MFNYTNSLLPLSICAHSARSKYASVCGHSRRTLRSLFLCSAFNLCCVRSAYAICAVVIEFNYIIFKNKCSSSTPSDWRTQLQKLSNVLTLLNEQVVPTVGNVGILRRNNIHSLRSNYNEYVCVPCTNSIQQHRVEHRLISHMERGSKSLTFDVNSDLTPPIYNH